MLNSLYIYSQTRKFWIILALSAFILEIISILIQYMFLLKPCILCIYQRCAIFGIIISGVIASINPNTFLRFIGIFVWIYSTIKGFIFSKKHVIMTLYPSPFLTCDLFVQFPTWLPLNQWCPFIFNTISGDCSSHKWYFLSLEMSQWMIIIFISYLTVAICTVISQLVYLKK